MLTKFANRSTLTCQVSIVSHLAKFVATTAQGAEMATPKYLAFISSTFKHMEEARKAALSGVSDSQHIPISLDDFTPQNASDMEVIKREVLNCQIYILLLGPTYGEIPKG